MNFKKLHFYAICLITLFAIYVRAYAIKWTAPTKDELLAPASLVDPDADVEILYRLQEIDDIKYGAPVVGEYIRIKVFNEKGMRKLAKIDIPYDQKKERIKSINARVVKPDGRIVEVEKKAFYDREIIRYGREKWHVRSFSFPALEPGCIAEYKWEKTAKENIVSLKLDFMSDMPAKRVVFRIRPAELIAGWNTEGYFFRCENQPLRRESYGFHSVEMKNLKAAAIEPFMPPSNDTQPWMMFYPSRGKDSAEAYWYNVATELHEAVEDGLRQMGPLVKSKALEITQNANSDAGRLRRINDYCHKAILNLDYYVPKGESTEEKSAKASRSPDKIIKSNTGNSDEIRLLFIALAKAAGVNAHMTLCPDRSHGAFIKDLPVQYFMRDKLVAVEFPDGWRFYDPARRLVKTGVLRWQNSGTQALVATPNGVVWVNTLAPRLVDTQIKRNGKFKLDENGQLTGEVKIEYTGHAEIEARQNFELETQQQIEKLVKEDVRKRLNGAEVLEVRISDVYDFEHPFALSYKISVPAYAEKVGSLMFVQPGFFSKGLASPFTAGKRAYGITFDYASNEKDEILISLPRGYNLEEGSSPAVQSHPSWGEHTIDIGFRNSDNTILYKRVFKFSPTYISVSEYPKIKRLFDIFSRNDAHTLAFRSDQ